MTVAPTAVRMRVGCYVAAGLFLALLPWLLVPSSPRLATSWSAVIMALGAYLTWCFWPRWTWGIGHDTMAQLPAIDGQRFRLTFDDGPTPGLTDRILDLLAARRVKASFFVLLAKARAHPALIRRIVDEGHVLGLHGEDHRSPFRRSAEDLQVSLARALADLEQLAGQPVTLYRPSHGWKNLALLRALSRLPLKISNWHHGVWDTDAPSADVLTARLWRVTPREDATACPIILLHDGLDDDPAVPRHAASLLESLNQWLPATSASRLQRNRSRVWRKLPALLWIALLVWTARRIEWAPVWLAFTRVPLMPMIAVLAASWLATVFQALRFYFLYPAGFGPVRHMALNFALQAGNVLLPVRSGELLRPFYMKRWNPALPLRQLLAWSVVDKVAEVIAILPFVLAACLVFASDPRFFVLSRWAWPAAGVLVGSGLLLIIFRWRRGIGQDSFGASGTRPATQRVVLSISCAFIGWLFNLSMFFLLIPDLRLALALLVAVNLAAAIPALPAGLGAFEAAFVWVGLLGGLPREQALALALVAHLVQILGTVTIGLPILSTWGWTEARSGIKDFV